MVSQGALPTRYRRVTVPSHKNHGFVKCVTDALPARYHPVLQKPWLREVRYRRVTVPFHKSHDFREVRYRRVTGALPSRPTKTMVS